jgi:hypothetical protein
LEGLAMDDGGILGPFCLFNGQNVYSMAIWYILWSLGIFFLFWYVVPRKIWQPWAGVQFGAEKETVFAHRSRKYEKEGRTKKCEKKVTTKFRRSAVKPFFRHRPLNLFSRI